MDKNNLSIKYAVIALFFLFSLSLGFVRFACAQSVYGCPNDKLIMFRPGTCPDGTNASAVEEGYICDANKVMLDTFSTEEKKQFGIIKDNKFIIVVYKSPASQESSFRPEKDSKGRQLKKSFVELQFACGDILSAKPRGSDCKPLGDKLDSIAERRKSLKRSLDESWPKFYQQNKQAGLSEEEIKSLWEENKNFIYQEQGYDPQSDEFIR